MKNALSAVLVLLSIAGGATALAAGPNDGVTAPFLVPESRVAPEYPPAAYDARIEGHVTVAALVLRDGTVARIDTLDASAPNLGFEAAAAEAIERWRFEPARKDGAAVDAYTLVRLNFRRTAGANSSGYVTAAFVPLDMLRSSIVVEGTSVLGGDSGTSMSSTSETGVGHYAAGRLPDELYDGKMPWVPERELALLEGVGPSQPPIGNTDK